MSTDNGDQLQGGEPRIGLQSIAAVAGSVAGSVALVYFWGGLVMWVRFIEADVPAGRAVSLLSDSFLLGVGLSEVILPVAVFGAVVALLFRWLDGRPPPRRRPSKSLKPWQAILLMAITLTVLFVLITVPTKLGIATTAVLVVYTVGVLYETKFWRPGPQFVHFRPPLRFWASLIGVVTVVLIISQAESPTRLESISVTTDTGDIRGRYVAIRSEGVYVGQSDRIVAVPNDTLKRITIGRAPRREDRRAVIDLLVDEIDRRW